MAKKDKKQRTPGPRVWHPEPDDAIRLAALRWFALSMERLSIEIYASDKTRFETMEELFRYTMKKLGKMRHLVDVGESEECPSGYVLCEDGLCAPMCDGEVADNES